MRRIAIINQKGGVGKTTTAVNVGSALARAGHRVLMVDLDPQSHLSLHLGYDPAAGEPGTYELLSGEATIAKARKRVANNLWIVGASIDLAAAEVELVSVVGREVILRDLLLQHVGGGEGAGDVKYDSHDKYDYVLMDCPPSLGVLTLNGLAAAEEVMIPLQPHYLALQGLGKLLETVSLVSHRINTSLKVAGVVICMNDAGTKLAGEVIDDVRSFFEQARGTETPWADARVFDTMIRRNIKLAEAPSYGQSIYDYAPDSNGAKDYERLAMEIHSASRNGELSPSTALRTDIENGDGGSPADAGSGADSVCGSDLACGTGVSPVKQGRDAPAMENAQAGRPPRRTNGRCHTQSDAAESDPSESTGTSPADQAHRDPTLAVGENGPPSTPCPPGDESEPVTTVYPVVDEQAIRDAVMPIVDHRKDDEAEVNPSDQGEDSEATRQSA